MWKQKFYHHSQQIKMNDWIEKNKEKYIIEKSFVWNGFIIEYKNRRIINIF